MEQKGEPQLNLSKYLPYRLAIAAEAISREVSGVYREQYKLSRDEWRILAALGELSVLKTRDIREYTTLDKVQASRAIVRMESAGYLSRQDDPLDRRNHVLALTAEGRALYLAIVPEVKAVENALLANLSKAELDAFNATLGRLLAAIEQSGNNI